MNIPASVAAPGVVLSVLAGIIGGGAPWPAVVVAVTTGCVALTRTALGYRLRSKAVAKVEPADVPELFKAMRADGDGTGRGAGTD
ncbi:hypothetical protein [Streptomyces sp. NRRL F-4474]|uniref:hypothetical protein n=1 Tax=Streptomyces sp. NRRL F-4474 TaxID=1463851 RepID=UPI0004C94553|nr:hypothetical protein [Streptomyces sp. NRRL F-4474]